MRVLVATDAWHPQVNGVVRTLTSLARAAAKLGVTIEFLSPEGFPSFPVPTYPGLRLALPNRRGIARRIEAARPDAIHIATEGPIGLAVRSYCRRQRRPFTTSYTTRFPEYISARSPIPEAWIYAVLRRFHAAATVTMVATPSLMTELTERGFANLGMWTRGVDTDLFRPDRAIDLGLPRPIFMTVGRVAVEKNLEAFLSLDLPGTKVVIGTGPQEAELKRKFPDAKFLGMLDNGILASHLAAAPTCSCFQASPTRSASCSSKRSRAAFRSPLFRSPGRRTSSPTIRSASCTRIWPSLVWARCRCRATPAAPSRSTIRGKTARGSSSAICAKWSKRQSTRRLADGHGTGHGYGGIGKTAQRGNKHETRRSDLDKETITKAYARWAPVYDLVFGAVFERGRHAAIAAAERIGGRILEVGVGTGISLPDYSPANRICGVDISEPMLRKAQERVAELGLSNVEGLWVMDAEHLRFPTTSFDVVVAQYVITTVPNPGGDARRVRPRAQAGRRDRAGQPGRRRSRLAARAGALVCAGGAQARLAHRVFLRALRAMGVADGGRAAGRAPRRCRRSGISR